MAADRLGEALSIVFAGFVTGAFAASVFLAYLLRKHGQPEAQGRRAGVYIAVGGLLATTVAAWLFVSPWLD